MNKKKSEARDALYIFTAFTYACLILSYTIALPMYVVGAFSIIADHHILERTEFTPLLLLFGLMLPVGILVFSYVIAAPSLFIGYGLSIYFFKRNEKRLKIWLLSSILASFITTLLFSFWATEFAAMLIILSMPIAALTGVFMYRRAIKIDSDSLHNQTVGNAPPT